MRAVEITKDTFPVGQPVVIEAICDGACGWEFDAPLHIMRPFHRYHIVGGICEITLEDKIEDLLIDLDLGDTITPDTDSWPYSEAYLDRLFRRARRGVARQGVWYMRSVVTVNAWGCDRADECVDYDIETELFYRGEKIKEPTND